MKMKKYMKRITSILLVLLLAVTAVSLAACGSDSDAAPKNIASDKGDPSPADDNAGEPAETEAGAELIDSFENSGVKHELYSDGTLIVSGEGGAWSNGWEKLITKVIAGEGITDMHFAGCENLTEVVIPESMQVINEEAFSGCSLTEVVIPDSVRVIEKQAFSGCDLTKVSIPEGVLRIGLEAFARCHNLAEIELPDSLIFVGRNAFGETALFETVDGVKYAGNVAVGYTNTQGSLTFREGTRIIADDAFDELDSITSVTFPDSVVRIGQNAFIRCSNLAEINVPDSVYSIGSGAFYQTAWFKNQPEDAVVYAGKVAYHLERYGSDILDLALKEGTVGIADNAFEDCYFDTVTLPSGLKWIGDGADLVPNKQEELVIPDGITYIGRDAVRAQKIIFPASVTYIEEGTFNDSGVTIIAPKGSYAESYALKNNILFKER